MRSSEKQYDQSIIAVGASSSLRWQNWFAIVSYEANSSAKSSPKGYRFHSNKNRVVNGGFGAKRLPVCVEAFVHDGGLCGIGRRRADACIGAIPDRVCRKRRIRPLRFCRHAGRPLPCGRLCARRIAWGLCSQRQDGTGALYRVLHFLALAVIVVHFVPQNWSGLRSRLRRPLVVCGQRSLEVFCVGIFLSFVGHFILELFSERLVN